MMDIEESGEPAHLSVIYAAILSPENQRVCVNRDMFVQDTSSCDHVLTADSASD